MIWALTVRRGLNDGQQARLAVCIARLGRNDSFVPVYASLFHLRTCANQVFQFGDQSIRGRTPEIPVAYGFTVAQHKYMEFGILRARSSR